MIHKKRYLRPKWQTFLALLLLIQIGSACEFSIPTGSVPPGSEETVFAAFMTRDPDEAVDVVFVPDDDYGDMSDDTARRTFLDAVEKVIDDGFWQNNAIVSNFTVYNYWYMTVSGDVQPDNNDPDLCPQVTWPNMSDAAFAEVIILLHPNTLRDCGGGSRATSEPVNGGTVVHEHSHVVYLMPDEYCCDGGYYVQTPILYSSEDACESDSDNAAWRDCRSFTASDSSGGLDWWRSEDNLRDIMFDDEDTNVPEYGRADWVVMKNYLSSIRGIPIGTPTVFGPDSWSRP